MIIYEIAGYKIRVGNKKMIKKLKGVDNVLYAYRLLNVECAGYLRINVILSEGMN